MHDVLVAETDLETGGGGEERGEGTAEDREVRSGRGGGHCW